MNNTAIISTLAAIVVAVVLIFTEGTLAAAAAAATSSPTPQLQNLICTYPANNATCSHEAIISTATQIPLPTSQQLQPRAPAVLAITRHVIDDIVATISAKDFSIGASGTNVSPQSSFQGAQSPGAATAVTSKPGTFPVALLQQANATTITANATTITANATTITANATTITAVAADHNKCSGGGDIITCTYIQETHYPVKDTTTPFVLPIPFP